MSTTVEIVLPVFGLLLAGWLMARIRLLSPDGVRGLTTFVFYIAIPALLFRNLGLGQTPGFGDLAIVAAYFLPSLAIVAVAGLLLGRLLGLKPTERVVFGMGGAFSNNVQLGIPLVLAAYGEGALVLLMLIISVHSIVMIGVPTATMEIVRGKGDRAGTVLRTTLKALVRNPIIVALCAGLIWGIAGWPIPALVDRFAGMLGQAAVPCSLFAMGAALAGYRLAGAMRDAVLTAGVKLLLHPVLVWLMASVVLDLPPLQVAVATTAAALPIGVNVFILAQTYETYTARASSAIVLSTAASIISLGLLVTYFRFTLGA